MVRTSSLTVLVAQGDASWSSVLGAVRSVIATGQAADVQVIATSPPAGDSAEGSDHVAGSIGDASTSVTFLDGSIRPADVLNTCSTQFLGILHAQAAVVEGTLERHLRALHDHTEAVLSVSLACPDEEREATETRALLLSAAAGTDSRIVDGRAFARALLFDGWPLDTVPSVLVVRTSAAVGPRSDHLERHLTEGGASERDLYGILLAMLTRGSVWSDPEVGVNVGPRPPTEGYPQWRRWSEIMEAGSELGLVDGPGEAVQALICHTRRTAALLRRPRAAGPGALFDHRAELVRGISESWRSLITTEASMPPLLPLHVAILPDDDPDKVAASADVAGRIAARVSILASPLDPPPIDAGGGLPTPEGWTANRDLARLLEGGDFPVLIVRAGEKPEILDRRQLTALLEDPGPHRPLGTIATPSGFQPRLVWSGSSDAPRSETPDTPPVYSLRLGTTAPGEHQDWLPPSTLGRGSHRLTKFIVVAPDYTEIHGGVVALHRLCDRLNALGYEAFVHSIGVMGDTRPDWLTPQRRGRSMSDAVMVYPEIVTGNPFEAKRVVRWLLNRPGWFTGSPMGEGPDDLVVAFDQQISSEHAVVSVPLIDPFTFFPKDRPGSGSLLWIGKGRLPGEFDRSDKTLITNSWPAERTELAALLRGADVLYTCDWLTSIIDEALMCATPVILIGDQTWSRHEIAMRPGMAWEDEADFDRARRDACRYYPRYLESLHSVDASIERFVQLVNDHFDAVDGRPVPID